ncbi:MAG: family 43 glycosylhydrolase [Sedimentisphaerales bacterium]|nr:family 43 glycosylhydrolase [Sedimentisphaerales bacterium]
MYRLKKFARKRRAAVAAGAAIAASLIVGLVVSTIMYFQAEQARVCAVDAEGIAQEQREVAEAERDRAEMARRQVHKEKELTQEALENLIIQKEKTDQLLYYQNIELAARAIEEVNWAKAKQFLLDCPAKFRAWEWGRLLYLCNLDRVTFSDNPGKVLDVAFSPDGSLVAAGLSRDHAAKIWELDSEKLLFTLQSGFRHFWSVICSVAFSPDGKVLATGSGLWLSGEYNTLVLWDVKTGKELLILKGHRRAVLEIAFSRDGNILVTSGEDKTGEDKTVKLWDAHTGEELRSLVTNTDAVCSIVFSSDGKHLVTGSQDGTVIVWDIDQWVESKRIQPDGSAAQGVFISPGGDKFARVADGGTIELWNIKNEKLLKTLPNEKKVTCVAFSPRGEYLAIGNNDGTSQLWSTISWSEILNFRGHASEITSIAFSPTGNFFATGSSDTYVKIWNTHMIGEKQPLSGHTGEIQGTVFSPDGQILVTAGGTWYKNDDQTARIWEVETGKELGILQHSQQLVSVDIDRNGRFIATATVDIMKIWDLQTKQIIKTVPHKELIRTLSFSPDGNRLAVGCRAGSGSICIWDTQTWEKIQNIWPESFDNLAWSPDGNLIAWVGYKHDVKLFDVNTEKEILTFRGHSAWVRGIAFSPNGKYLATGSNDRTVRLWNVETGKEYLTLRGGNFDFETAIFDPEGKRVLAGSRTGDIVIWDVATGRNIMTFNGHAALIRSIAFSPDGRYLASGGSDQIAIIWPTFPWIEDEYHGHSDMLISQRIKVYKRSYWGRSRLPMEEHSKIYSAWEYIKAGKFSGALELLEELKSSPHLKEPEMVCRNESLTKRLSGAFYNRGQREERCGNYGKAISDYYSATCADHNHTLAWNNLAWLQAACSDAKFRDGREAIVNATRACGLTDWKEYRYICTLAAAYAEAGDFDSATKWQKEAIDLLSEEERPTWHDNYAARLKQYQSGRSYHAPALTDGNISTYCNPLEVLIADPFILKDKGIYYLYGTTNPDEGFRAWKSKDLANWQVCGFVFRKTPKAWAQVELWAPEVLKKNGNYYLFFSAANNSISRSKRICVAQGDSPLGPFHEIAAPLFDTNNEMIDAHVFVDDDGKAYLYFSVFISGVQEIHVTELEDNLIESESNPVFCIRPSQSWEGNIVNEAPFVLKHRGTYYLMYSANRFDDVKYSVGFATADNPMGPWTKYRNNPILKKTDQIAGTGHNCIISSPDKSEFFIAYHCHSRPNGFVGVRQLMIDRMRFAPDPGYKDKQVVGGPTLTPRFFPKGADKIPIVWEKDDFVDPNLDRSRWITVFSEAPDSWKINNGNLVITTQSNDVYRTQCSGKNIILQYAPPLGDWIITTKVEFAPERNFEQAFLTVWQDHNNYLMLKKICYDGSNFQVLVEQNENSIYENHVNLVGDTAYLRILKTDSCYTFQISPDRKNWTTLGEPVKAYFYDLKVGIGAMQSGSGIERDAKFDFFELSKTENTLPVPVDK